MAKTKLNIASKTKREHIPAKAPRKIQKTDYTVTKRISKKTPADLKKYKENMCRDIIPYNAKEKHGLFKRRLRKLGYAGGIKRMASTSYTLIADDIIQTTRRIGSIAAVVAEYDKRNTISARDIEFALKVVGKKVYC